MLILSRLIDQVVCIGDDVTVKVVSIRGDKVRLGFDAPREIQIDRLEVREAKQQEREHED